MEKTKKHKNSLVKSAEGTSGTQQHWSTTSTGTIHKLPRKMYQKNFWSPARCRDLTIHQPKVVVLAIEIKVLRWKVMILAPNILILPSEIVWHKQQRIGFDHPKWRLYPTLMMWIWGFVEDGNQSTAPAGKKDVKIAGDRWAWGEIEENLASCHQLLIIYMVLPWWSMGVARSSF